jgi:unsaturated chondroitin disaccharide hydrolase
LKLPGRQRGASFGPLKIDATLTPKKLVPKLNRLFEVSAQRILALQKAWDPARGAPVFTVKGKYTARGWTEWTQGFQFGSALLQFDAAGDARFLEIGRTGARTVMVPHLTHIGVHDHGFNTLSTYGNLLRLLREGKIHGNGREKAFYELALKTSGAVQAARWTRLSDNAGYLYSFNGPHSLFIDTLRTLRALGVAHRLGHLLLGESDRKISLLQRLAQHALTTARFNIYYGQGRDLYDVHGRVAQECIFNLNDGSFRCPNSQQGWSPFSTWTRGLGWALLGFAEQLEFLQTLPPAELDAATAWLSEPEWAEDRGRELRTGARFERRLTAAATAVAGHYLGSCCADGVPMWDTDAPRLNRLGDYRRKAADPFNEWEPVDSSAAAIAAQGLIRLGGFLNAHGDDPHCGERLRLAGFTIANTLFDQPYLSTHPRHQGLLLHSVYHRPNGWDYVAPGQAVPNGESSMWGDYHARELALLLLREARGEEYLTFFGGLEPRSPARSDGRE